MTRWTVYLAILGFLMFCLIANANPNSLEILLWLAIGWIPYIYGIFSRITVNWEGVATAAACLVGLAVGLHYFCGWLHGKIATMRSPEVAVHPHWRPRWTFALLAGVVLMFLAGIAAVGLTHQTIWLATSHHAFVGGSKP
jgi:hypothetical protein